MINSALYRDPVLLDSKVHRHKRLKAPTDLFATRNMHAVFLTATEFPQAVLEFPIIFVDTGERLASGKPMFSPVALLGLVANENLRLTPEGRWDALYLPAFVRRFPFLTAGVKGETAPSVFIDAAYGGFNDTEGEPLFTDAGEPTPALKQSLEFLQRFEDEQQRTRHFCARITELDLLKEMHVDATLPSGDVIKVEGFYAADEERLNKLPDATVTDLHRSGMLMLLQAHLLSLGHMRDLVERKARRMAAQAGSAAHATPAGTPA